MLCAIPQALESANRQVPLESIGSMFKAMKKLPVQPMAKSELLLVCMQLFDGDT